MENVREIRRQFSEFLNTFDWSSFGTFTFSNAAVQGGACDRLYKLLCSMASERQPVTGAFICEERGPRGGRVHLHALCSHPGWTPGDLEQRWEEHFGFATVRQFDSARGAGYYVTKYVVKEDFDLAEWRLYTTSDFGAEDDLFTARSRTTGYQLYSRWRQELAAAR